MKKITEIEEHSYSVEGPGVGCAIAFIIGLTIFLILAVILCVTFIIISIF